MYRAINFLYGTGWTMFLVPFQPQYFLEIDLRCNCLVSRL